MVRLSLLLLLLVGLPSLVGCRSPDELTDAVNAIVFVFDVDDNERAVIDVADVDRRSQEPKNDVVQFQLVLSPGAHTGTITIVRVRGDDDRDDDRGDDDDRDEPDRCGTFDIEVVKGAVASAAVLADELPRCRDDGPGEGEGDDDGEGEADGEGEGEDDGEGEDEPDGEGEGEPDGEGEGEDEPDGEGEDEPDGQ